MENIEKYVTELKKIIARSLPAGMQETAWHYLEMIENDSRSKAYFLAMMSHEIRTPMSGVIGVADLLYETSLSSKQKYLVDTIKISGDSIITLLNDILEFSKLEYGKFTIDNKHFNLTECIEDSLKLFAPLAHEKKLSLSYNINKNVPEYIESDDKRLRQIFVNLLSNAIKHTEKGEITISVEKKSVKGEIVELLFRVKDTGYGISADNIGKLFKPFEQVSHNFTGQYGGTGLGLAISKKLTELLKGDIWAESETGKGSTFYFTIIAGIAYGKTNIGGSEKSLTPFKRNILLSEKYPFSILVADDNTINRKLILKILENMGCSAEVACNGKEVIEMVLKKKFDVIFMDIQMPVMDGYEATKQICKKIDEAERPWIVAITANAMLDDKEKCFAIGMDEYMSKPIRKEDLYNILEKIAKSN